MLAVRRRDAREARDRRHDLAVEPQEVHLRFQKSAGVQHRPVPGQHGRGLLLRIGLLRRAAHELFRRAAGQVHEGAVGEDQPLLAVAHEARHRQLVQQRAVEADLLRVVVAVALGLVPLLQRREPAGEHGEVVGKPLAPEHHVEGAGRIGRAHPLPAAEDEAAALVLVHLACGVGKARHLLRRAVEEPGIGGVDGEIAQVAAPRIGGMRMLPDARAEIGQQVVVSFSHARRPRNGRRIGIHASPGLPSIAERMVNTSFPPVPFRTRENCRLTFRAERTT